MQVNRQDLLHENTTILDDMNPSVEADVHLLESESHQLHPHPSTTVNVQPKAGHAKSQQATCEPVQSEMLTGDNVWLPLGLRFWFLISLSAAAFSAAAVCIGLLIYSSSNYGLGTDDGKLSLSFAWRFLPTLLAVLYVIGISIVFNDVNRTEAFSRLSNPTPSDPRWTIFRAPGAWWATLGEALNRTKNGQKMNWVLLSATTVYILGFLAISPLSSSLLDSVITGVVSPSSFSQPDVLHTGRLPFEANQDAYLRTVAHQLQNLTTSAWINNDYTILPFGLTEASSISIGPAVTDQSVQWKASTMVLKTEMKCEVMNVTRVSSGLVVPNSTFSYNTISFSDGKGCNLTFSDANTTKQYSYGFGSWYIAPDYIDASPPSGIPWVKEIRPNITDACRDREIILAISSWPLTHKVNSSEIPSNDSIAASYVCDTQFYMANSSVIVRTNSQGTSTILIDTDEFARDRTAIQPSFFNATLFHRTMMAMNWTSVLGKSGKFAHMSETGGPLRLLSGMYNFDIKKMILDPNLAINATSFKQRFLGETIMAAFEGNIARMNRTDIAGEIIIQKQRIVVSTGVAIALIILLFLSGVQLVFILFMTRPTQRPLHVDQDPSSLAGLATLLLHEQSTPTRKLFRGLEQAALADLASMLSDTRHQLTDNGLHSIGRVQPLSVKSKSKRSDWRPLATKRRNGLGLLLYLMILIGGVAAFWATYLRSGLYGPAFSFEGQVTIQNSTFVLAPYSMIPTLLAVLVGLWWSDVVQTFRRVQPFVEMAKRPTGMSSGPQLTYASFYNVFGAFKAARKRHWILALVFLGSIFTEVFTVSMSAIWRRKPVIINEEVVLMPHLEFRTSPQMFHFTAPETGSDNSIPSETIGALYSSLNTNWMYSALLQLVFNASEPPWSRDGWSFTPSDLSVVSNSSAVMQDTTQLADRRLLLNEPAINVTLRTSALRARLDCNPFEGVSNLSSWLTQWDLTNGTQWNSSANPSDLATGYQLGFIDLKAFGSRDPKTLNWNNGMQLKSGSTVVKIPFLNNQSPLQCCPNASAGTSHSMSVGYWTYRSALYEDASAFVSSFSRRSSSRGDNITTKVIYGHPQKQLYQRNTSFKDVYGWDSDGNLIWRDVPQLTALNCQPLIEFADAEVKVDRSSAMVQDFRILSVPQIIEQDAWNASYNLVNYTKNSYRAKEANYIASYGVLFEDALIFASDTDIIASLPPGGRTTSESISNTFNYKTPGLNMDFMTYAMHSLTAADDPKALLDPVLQARLANLVFGTFFQHFVSSNVTKNGSWTYVPVGTNKFDPNTKPYNHSAYPQYDKVTAIVSRRVEGLEMSLTATSLCLGVLSFLIITTIVVYLIGFRYFDHLRHDVETMADVIRLISDSPKFLAWVADESKARYTRSKQPIAKGRPISLGSWRKFWKRDPYQALAQDREKRQEPKVRLGTFIGTDDKPKWIVEVED